MAMSKDRVRFTISGSNMHGMELRGLLERAFGFSHKRPQYGWQDQVIVCRPSQFARFLILRNDLGMANSFKELKPELFTPSCFPAEVDVSQNPNTVDT
jgi:hypothetical protein